MFGIGSSPQREFRRLTMQSDSETVVAIGPIQLVAIAFPEYAEFTGEIINALAQVRGRGAIRLIDALFVHKNNEGKIDTKIRDSDLTTSQRMGLGAAAGALVGFIEGGGDEDAAIARSEEAIGAIAEGAFGLGLGDLQKIQEDIEPGMSALLLLIEHTWATELKYAIRGVGGVPVLQGFLTPEALLMIGAEVQAVVEAENTIALAEAVKGAAVLDALVTVVAAEEVKEAAAAEAARSLIAAGLIEESDAEEVVATLVNAGLISEDSVSEATKEVEAIQREVAEMKEAQAATA
jgi:uncharacterized membrane protein